MSENVKPTQGESDYFALEDALKKRRLALAMKKEMADAEAQKLKELHQGFCPGCGHQMQQVNLRDVPVSVCFACDGVFLHKNELLAFQSQIQQGRRGVVAAILNWFRPEVEGSHR